MHTHTAIRPVEVLPLWHGTVGSHAQHNVLLADSASFIGSRFNCIGETGTKKKLMNLFFYCTLFDNCCICSIEWNKVQIEQLHLIVQYERFQETEPVFISCCFIEKILLLFDLLCNEWFGKCRLSAFWIFLQIAYQTKINEIIWKWLEKMWKFCGNLEIVSF